MPTKDESLLVHWDVVFLLQLHLDVEYRVVFLHHDRYCSPRQRLDKYLHVEKSVCVSAAIYLICALKRVCSARIIIECALTKQVVIITAEDSV